jgi:hypothetical protein
MTSQWRLAARAAIQKAIASLPPDCDRTQIKKAIDQAYPFTFRDYHPYKIWLSERKSFFVQLGICADPGTKSKTKKKVKPVSIPTGQLSLFDQVNIIGFDKDFTD